MCGGGFFDQNFDRVYDLGEPSGSCALCCGVVRGFCGEFIGDKVDVVLSFAEKFVVRLVGCLPGVCEDFWSSLRECLASKLVECSVEFVYIEDSCGRAGFPGRGCGEIIYGGICNIYLLLCVGPPGPVFVFAAFVSRRCVSV